MLANESTWRPRRGRMHSHTSMKAVPRPRQATCRPPVCKISRACYEAVSPSSCVLFKRVQNVKEHQVETGSEAARAGKGRQHVYASALRRRTLKDSEHIGSAARHSVLSASGAAWFATQVTATAAAAQKTSPVCSGRSKRQKVARKDSQTPDPVSVQVALPVHGADTDRWTAHCCCCRSTDSKSSICSCTASSKVRTSQVKGSRPKPEGKPVATVDPLLQSLQQPERFRRQM